MMASAAVTAMFGSSAVGQKDLYSFGVFPYLPALKIEKLYSPLTSAISDILGSPTQLKTKRTFEGFRAELARTSYDVALMHPFFAVEAQDYFHYDPLVRVAGDLRAVVLGRADTGLAGFGDLRGRTLALPAPLAGVTYLAKLELIERGINPNTDITLLYFRSKGSCLHAVATKAADACVIPSFMIDQLEAIGQMNLKQFALSRPIPNLILAAAKRLGPEKCNILCDQMVKWQHTEQGKYVLQQANWPNLIEVHDHDFLPIRKYQDILSRNNAI